MSTLKELLNNNRKKTFWNDRVLRFRLPSICAVGEKVSAKIALTNQSGLPDFEFNGALLVDVPETVTGLPRKITLSEGGAIIDDICFTVPGCFRIEYNIDGYVPDLRLWSNPVIVQENPSYRLYWGDLHVHTTHGNCNPKSVRDPEFAYLYARDVSFLDFIALTDHIRGLDKERWGIQQKLIHEYYRAGKFVPFLGFESSHATGYGGDNNVYFAGNEGDYFIPEGEGASGNRPKVPIEDLWNFMDSQNLEHMTIPHHTGRPDKYRSWNEGRYSIQHEPLFEIYSCFGSSEKKLSCFPHANGGTDQPAYFQDAIVRGCKFGVFASSDDHTTLPGAEVRQRIPFAKSSSMLKFQKGLAAVYAKDLSRQSLWEALKSRRCYATTYDMGVVEFWCNGLFMGEEIQVSSISKDHHKRELTIVYKDVDEGKRPFTITIIRNGKEISSDQRPGPDFTYRFIDETPLEKVLIQNSEFNPASFVCYYARIQKSSGETYWTSPIWIEYE